MTSIKVAKDMYLRCNFNWLATSKDAVNVLPDNSYLISILEGDAFIKYYIAGKSIYEDIYFRHLEFRHVLIFLNSTKE